MVRQSRTPIVLLTRPAPQSRRFAGQLRETMQGAEIVISPLLQAEFLKAPIPDQPFRAVILSSETGALAAGRLRGAGHTLPARAYCVGDHTAHVARLQGFDALSAQGDAQALAQLVRLHEQCGPLLHLRGRETAGDLAERLTAGGLVTHSMVVYAQNPVALTSDALDLFLQDSPIIVPVFSSRSAGLLVAAIPETRKAPLWIVAISDAAAKACLASRPERLVVAVHPDGENMLHAVAEMLSSGAAA